MSQESVQKADFGARVIDMVSRGKKSRIGFTIMLGNAYDGLRFYGLYTDHQDAVTFAEWHYPDEEWHVVPIYKQEHYDA